MPTRLFTTFMIPRDDPLNDDKVKYWIDVQEDYDKVFNQLYPLTPPTSTMEARENFWYTKVDDGLRFSCMSNEIHGFEEIE